MDVSETKPFVIREGLTAAQRDAAAALFWQAFRRKLHLPMWPRHRALVFLKMQISPEHAIVALDRTGQVIGLAGYKTRQGAFVSGGLHDLHKVYGRFGGVWRGALLSVFERELEPGVMMMDGICVDASWRGHGIGSALLDAVKIRARGLNCLRIQLNVVDTNPKARALYLRQGFQVARVEDIWPLHWIYGFRRSDVMYCEL
ncbi:GNAT family N-acetyltransferase [Actibacterium ureilyticum]|uniref:GNAT family N-acetyltransferase n=1 Tax=Actibacterium ureilyticum TaxID=1590614 RepID=UPI000BAAB6D4|nr:GNAT family N-acetyltransferase [Actibacterium ureilyticum]